MARDDARDFLWRQSLQEYGASWDKHPCLDPFPISAIGLPSVMDPEGKPLPVELGARCRKCEQCLAHRRRLWTARAVDEIEASRRTWFGTLTVRPEDRFLLRCKADARAQARGWEPLSLLSQPEAFRHLASELNREATKFLKRLRKKSKGLRYILVTEAHKSGDPHLHLLLHEHEDAATKRQLEEQWRLGFSHWRLVDRDSSAAVYVCKYLAKEAQTRVRASLHYGQPTKVRVISEAAQTLADFARAEQSVSGSIDCPKRSVRPSLRQSSNAATGSNA